MVTDLPAATCEEDIATIFLDSGTVTHVTFRGPTSAFVGFSDTSHAETAVDKHHEKPMGTTNTTIKVEMASKEPFEGQLLLLMSSVGARKKVKTEPAKELGSSAHHTSHNPIRISTFSGDGGKGEVTYEQFRQELTTLQKQSLSPDMLLNSLTRSLRGTAAVTLLAMGDDHQLNLDAVVAEFDSLFGVNLPHDKLYTAFFAAEQKEDESITGWSSRLKHLLHQMRRAGINFPEESIREVLRGKLWSGIRDKAVRAAVHHRIDSGATYDELLVAARAAEVEQGEIKVAQAHLTAAHVPSTEWSSKLDAVLHKLEGMDMRLSQLEQPGKSGRYSQTPAAYQSQPPPAPQGSPRKFRGECYYCHQHGHMKSDCPALNAKKPASRGN